MSPEYRRSTLNFPQGRSIGRSRLTRATLAGLVLAAGALTVVPSSSALAVIVRAEPGFVADAVARVTESGGLAGQPLGIINGFAATVPEAAVASLEADNSIASVALDRPVHLMHAVDGFDGDKERGSVHNVGKSIGAHHLWRFGLTGEGVDIALIDSGVAPVEGLTTSGKIVNGPDLSFDSQFDGLRYMDLYGHGTHMAGIMAGRDPDTASTQSMTSHDTFVGVAPDARIVNVKVANAVGATDVSQVIAGIDWVVQHRNDNGLNIRVLNLSFGTDSMQDPLIDPLSHAVESAWHHGIFVVTSAGNRGADGLMMPAKNPYVLTVGASDSKGTRTTLDDEIPSWSSQGDGNRDPDLVAPGRSIASLKSPGSYLDETFPEARAGARFFRGSGTSQATAAMAGAAALLIEQRPSITPDQLKRLLTLTAVPVPGASSSEQGAGFVDLLTASRAPTPSSVQTWPTSLGTGSLEESRGTSHVMDVEGNVLTGEQDIFGVEWDGEQWATLARAGTSWSGGEWNGTSWSGSCWCGTSWSGTSWSGTSWSGTSWSGLAWGTSWSGTSWSGTSWSGTSWSGTSWSGTSWSGTSWSGTSWSGTSWSGTSWSAEGWG